MIVRYKLITLIKNNLYLDSNLKNTTKFNKVVKLKLRKKFLYFMKFQEQLKKYKKKYLTYIKKRTLILKKRNSRNSIYKSNI